jgi:hypothetical protein
MAVRSIAVWGECVWLFRSSGKLVKKAVWICG